MKFYTITLQWQAEGWNWATAPGIQSSGAFEDNLGRVIEFLSQISKLSHFNLLDFAEYLKHH